MTSAYFLSEGDTYPTWDAERRALIHTAVLAYLGAKKDERTHALRVLHDLLTEVDR